jgi:hypothetical protein
MNLSQSYDPGRKFNKLTRVDLDYFFIYFLWGYPNLITQVIDLVS